MRNEFMDAAKDKISETAGFMREKVLKLWGRASSAMPGNWRFFGGDDADDNEKADRRSRYDKWAQESSENEDNKNKNVTGLGGREKIASGVFSHTTDDGQEWLTLQGKGKKIGPGVHKLTEKQMVDILMHLVLKKGYSTIYCYRGLDPASDMASEIGRVLGVLQQPGGPLEGKQVHVSNGRMENPPWMGTLQKFTHNRSAAREAKEAEKFQNKVLSSVPDTGPPV